MPGNLPSVILRASISAASSGDNDLVAAVSEKKIRVLAIALMGSGTAVSVYIHDDADTPVCLYGDGTNKVLLDKTASTGPAGFVLPFNDGGWFETTAGKKLVLNLSAAQAVVGAVTYILV